MKHSTNERTVDSQNQSSAEDSDSPTTDRTESTPARPGSNRAKPTPENAFTRIDGIPFYRIENCGNLPPFLVNVVSDDDFWMFVGSNGAITTGRRTPDEALFPYTNQDQLFDSTDSTGSLTIIRTRDRDGGPAQTWEPWVSGADSSVRQRRSFYKDRTGSCVIFEEMNPNLGLRWRHSWTFSPRHGILRQAEILNTGPYRVQLRLLDGIRNVLPHGLNQTFQSKFSVLGDAYKMSELLMPEGMGLFTLSSLPTDRAEPNECLRANLAWSAGIEATTHLLSTNQVEKFRSGLSLKTEATMRGKRGAYLVESEKTLAPGESTSWWIVADVGITAESLAERAHWVRGSADRSAELKAEARGTRDRISRRIGSVDGVQSTADELRCWRHFSNTLFNSMRGGIFENGYDVPGEDFLRKLKHFNREVYDRQAEFLGNPLPRTRSELEERAGNSGDPDLIRLAGEYLPLSFSRRHGDPSRPWNQFAIDIMEPDGTPRYAYQGNWRDIFQNWEALIHAYPDYSRATIFRFVNASTADGYNPYRLTDQGFEWESPSPDEPWSNIGYWGDHQIIYLLKLLEISEDFHPGQLTGLLDKQLFSYAQVPYRIRSYTEIIKDPRNTVDYAEDIADRIEKQVQVIGADGRLLHLPDGSICRVGLMEKLLVPLLAKLANFTPEGGIWMNTQRPEWNDANNALVGFGVSVVTLGYVHRYLQFLIRLLESTDRSKTHELSSEVADWLSSQAQSFGHVAETQGTWTPMARRNLLDQLGAGATAYRTTLYQQGLSGQRKGVATGPLLDFLQDALVLVAGSLKANIRGDGLYHAYNILSVTPGNGIDLQRLAPMLEGQVSILSSGLLEPAEALSVLDALRQSTLYRKDLGTYLLYPNRELPRFLERNRIEPSMLHRSDLLNAMLEAGATEIVVKDRERIARFNSSFRNRADLADALTRLAGSEWGDRIDQERETIEEIYESTFNHRSFTGRSGTFFAYEGLGSVYWHMVSKLILAIQEIHRSAVTSEADPATIERLADHYHHTLAGLGIHHAPELFGAFPTDAYSHTPAHAGAQQPGMTGQVKEDLLIRWGELGLSVSDGCLEFNPRLLGRSEFHSEANSIVSCDNKGHEETLNLPPESLAFTFCQVPVIFQLADRGRLRIERGDGTTQERPEASLNREESNSVFMRDGQIKSLVLSVDRSLLPD